MTANRDGEAEGFDGEAAENEGRPWDRSGEQHDGGYGEKESGWHDEQSRVFHDLSLSSLTEGSLTRKEWKAALRTRS